MIALLLVSTALLSSCGGPQCASKKCCSGKGGYCGWRLGMQAYSFKEFTFFEAVDKTASLEMKVIEAYPGQRFSPERPEAKFHHTMSAELKNEAKQKLCQAKVKLVNYGVVSLPNDEAECRQVFDFAKEMGIETIVSEPKADALDLVEKLCEEYQIKMAIHNHPAPSRYWDPDRVVAAVKGRSKLMGACADTGHWMRSGVCPIEALKKLEGRIISLHLKDLGEFGNKDAHDVIWGTGKGNVKAMLTELDRQKFKGVFSAEYEHNWENSVPDLRQCAQYFNKVADELGKKSCSKTCSKACTK